MHNPKKQQVIRFSNLFHIIWYSIVLVSIPINSQQLNTSNKQHEKKNDTSYASICAYIPSQGFEFSKSILSPFAFRFNTVTASIGSNTNALGIALVGGLPHEKKLRGGSIFLGGPSRNDNLCNAIQFLNGSVECMRITQFGTVGIGTSNPGSYTLAVEGVIGAREIVVTTSQWADYVFSPQYDLKPLVEIEAYIQTHKHLPGVPTLDEVQQHGISLGQMQTILLSKVEELTLYMIQLHKRVDSLEIANKILKLQLDSMNNTVP